MTECFPSDLPLGGFCIYTARRRLPLPCDLPSKWPDTAKEEEEKGGQNPCCSAEEREKKGKTRAIAKKPVKGVKGKKVAKRKK